MYTKAQCVSKSTLLSPLFKCCSCSVMSVFFYPLLNKKETHTNRFVVFLLISRSTERLMLCFVAVPKSRVFNSHSMILSISRRRRMPQSCTESQNLCSKKKQKTTSVVLSNWSIDQCLGKRPVSTLMGRYDNS